MQMTVESIDNETRKIHLKPKQKTEEDIRFENLLKDVNRILFYLSNVEVQKAQMQGHECPITQPVEVVYHIKDEYVFRDDLEAEYGMNKQNLKESIDLVLDKNQKNIVVIDDPNNGSQEITIDPIDK